MKFLEEEHEMKMQILNQELQGKIKESEQRTLEHQLAVRNLDTMFNFYSQNADDL